MKNYRWFLGVFMAAVLLSSTFSINAHAQESMLPIAPIIIDDEPISTKYTLRDGHLLVPAIFLKNTGAMVDWDEKYRSVVFHTKDIKFALPVGKKFSDNYNRTTGTWTRGTLSTEAIEFNGIVFVPLVDVAKKLGMKVKYDQTVNRTFISTNISNQAKVYKEGQTSEKLVALTFDDGPENHYTPRFLDILKEKGVPATFFVTGQQMNDFPDVMKRIVQEGHAIGNHTFRHPDLRTKWTSTVREELASTQQMMQKVVGRRSDIFRPPYGAVTKADLVLLHELGLRTILWSVDTLDWSGVSADQILEIVHRDITPGGIILQHNFQYGQLLEGSVEALPRMIDDLQKQGYQFVTVQTLLSRQRVE
jgi:peptidoglycan-N-acetylglucosamine deacetylase